jgi:hypothetical protein
MFFVKKEMGIVFKTSNSKVEVVIALAIAQALRP